MTSDAQRLTGSALLVLGVVVLVLLGTSKPEPKAILLIPVAAMVGGWLMCCAARS